jgi:hypothetical protein
VTLSPEEARKDRLRTLTIIGLVFIATVLFGTWYFYQQGQRKADDFGDCIDRGHAVDYCDRVWQR